MAFGPRPGDLKALLALGATSEARLAAYVEQQLNPAAIADAECDARLAAQNFTTLGKSLPQLWADHVIAEDIEWSVRMAPANETLRATFIRAVYSKRQLVEVLADFWHNHFNVFGFDYWSGPVWVHYDRDVIRRNMLGNFRTMLGTVAKSPAMLYYLDNISNSSAGPNENFARELFELHGMGAENYLGVVSDRSQVPVDGQGKPVGYIDEDVYGATRSFTGWRVDEDTGAFLFADAEHDKYAKTVLNVNIPSFSGVQDGETVLDLIANHPGTGRYISRKLCRRLIADNPPESVVQAAASVFYAQRSAPDQLKQVVRTILLSAEFRSTWGEKIKRPFEYAVSLLRAANADFGFDDSFSWVYESMGQPLFEWRPPNGYPDVKEDWASTMPMLQRWRFCNWLMDGWRYGGTGRTRTTCASTSPARCRPPLPRRRPSSTIGPTVSWGGPCRRRSASPSSTSWPPGATRPSISPAEEIADRLRFMVGLIFMAPSFLWR